MPSEVKAQDTTSLASIKTVNEAATQSRALLAEMEQAAQDAGTTLDGIYQDAKDAQTAADSAKQSADTAFTNLSQVQSVLEVAQWIATHGTYVKATVFNPNAIYYTITATQVTEPSDDDKDSQGVLIYYELDNGTYVRTTDTNVDEQKTYYRVTGTPVAQPSAEYIADYYTLAVSEAMADYVQSHLALTNDGLYVMADNSEWKVLVRATGIDIIDGTGATDVVVATFDNDGTTFYDGQGTSDSNITAEFSSNGAVIGKKLSYNSRVKVTEKGIDVISGIDKVTAHLGSDWRGVGYAILSPPASTTIEYDSTATYEVGNLCLYLDEMYVCVRAIESPKAWDSNDWAFADMYGVNAVIAGFGGLSIGSYSYAGGLDSRAIGECSHTEGRFSVALGDYSYAGGDNAVAEGDYSHSEGYYTITKGDASTALGNNTIASASFQLVIGLYNDNQRDTAFEIGNGSSENNRSNAFTVEWSGNVEFALDTTAQSGDDHDIYTALQTLGWDNDVIV